MDKYKKIISKFFSKKILVIGDIILDQHIVGSVSRISPEAPVPVVLQKEPATFSPGGAANVAYNLRSLGAKVTLVGRIGRDVEGKELLKGLKKLRISTRGVFVDAKIPTVLKTRILAQHQQVLRLDREKISFNENIKLSNKITGFLKSNLNSFDAVIISDYGKGLITRELVMRICSLAKKKKKIITVDPKVENFAYYRGVTAITPNKNEAENAIRNIKITESGQRKLRLNSDRLNTLADVVRAGKQLLSFMELESLMEAHGFKVIGKKDGKKYEKGMVIGTRYTEKNIKSIYGNTIGTTFTISIEDFTSKKTLLTINAEQTHLNRNAVWKQVSQKLSSALKM